MPVNGLLISCTTLADNFPKEAILSSCSMRVRADILGDIPGQVNHPLNPPFLIKQRVADHVQIAFPAILVKVDMDGGSGLAGSHGIF